MIPSETRLLRLLTWLTPAFAAGTFGYAHGLEAAIRERTVTDTLGLTAWISNLIEHGSGWTDAVLARAAWIAVTAEDHVALERIAALAEQQIASPHRRRESMAQGEAFLVAVAAWNPPASRFCRPSHRPGDAGNTAWPVRRRGGDRRSGACDIAHCDPRCRCHARRPGRRRF